MSHLIMIYPDCKFSFFRHAKAQRLEGQTAIEPGEAVHNELANLDQCYLHWLTWIRAICKLKIFISGCLV